MKSVRTRTVALAGAALLAVGALAACSSSSDDEATPSASVSPSPEATTSESSSPQPTSTSTSGPNSRSAGGDVTTDIPADYTLPQDIAPGTCYLRLPDAYDLSDGIKVDCAQPHYVEIISTFPWPKEYAGFIVDEWDNQEQRCADVVWEMGSKETGSYNFKGVDRERIWAPSADQLTAGEGTGYCTISGATDSTLLVGSAVAGTLENKD